MCDILKDSAIFDLCYTKKQELGRGRFGVVSRVTGTDGKDYAAKFVKIRKNTRVKTENEISILSQLSNPHIIKYVEAFDGLCEIIIVVEYMGGGELFERVASDEFNLTEADCCLFLRQICRGAEYLHSRNIIHLDLKPENIVCSDKNGCTVKIVDFGTALHIPKDEKVKTMCGTPEFVAPEIVTYNTVNSATDMWAVGVITYILLSGFSPFMGENDADTFTNISRVNYDFNLEEFEVVSSDAKDFIASLLVQNKRRRLTATECLSHPWILEENVAQLTVISTINLKKFLARVRWQRCGQAIRALKRVSSMVLQRRSSTLRSCTLDSQGSEISEISSGSDDTPTTQEDETKKKKSEDVKESARKCPADKKLCKESTEVVNTTAEEPVLRKKKLVDIIKRGSVKSLVQNFEKL